MEKNKLFDVNLDSLIEVDAQGDSNYPTELLEVQRPSDAKREENEGKRENVNEDEGLIDLEEIDGNEEDIEEEEEEDVQEEPSSKKQPPQSKSKTSSPLTPYAQLLIDEGVLPNFDIKKFDGSTDSLKEAMVEEIMGAVESYKDSLPQEIKHLINNYEEGVPFDRLLEINKIESDVSKISEDSLEEDVNLQKRLVTDYLKRTTKFSESKISKLVESYEDSGDLEDEAKTSLGELQKLASTEKERAVAEARAAKEQAEANRKAELKSLQDKIKATEEIIPGLKINQRVKDSIFSSTTTAVGYDQSGRPVNKIVAARMENPVEFEMKLHYLFEVTKGFKDFSKLVEKGKKDATKSFEEAVSQIDNSEKNESGEPRQLGKKSNDFFKSLNKTFNI